MPWCASSRASLERNVATKADIAAVQAEVERLRLETKADIDSLRQSTQADIVAVKADIEKLRLETQALVAGLKGDLIRWVLGLNLGVGALAVFKLLG